MGGRTASDSKKKRDLARIKGNHSKLYPSSLTHPHANTLFYPINLIGRRCHVQNRLLGALNGKSREKKGEGADAQSETAAAVILTGDATVVRTF